MPSLELVIRRASSSTGWDSVWRWLLEPVPENEETAVDDCSTDSGKAAPIAPLTGNDDAS